MPDFEQIIKGIKAILKLIFGNDVPNWISPVIGWALLVALGLCALWGILFLLSKIKELWSQNFWPLFYDREQKQRSLHRRYFAEHIESELIRLGRQEEWKDYRYTELEAEVEAEGQQKLFSLMPFIQRTGSSLRREKSLSRALASSQERLILVEGEPGSGKSIALRHVAQRMAAQAKKTRSTRSIIPLYVNLKELERKDGEAIDRNLIETFVLGYLKRIKDRDIDKFLDDEFNIGIENGTWFFLFDSFDEIPEVLSSTEADATIRNYGNAIEDFLSGMNRCRGIVASRLFRGPEYFRWPCFTILSLSESRRLQLIRKISLKRETESALLGNLETASDEIQTMASNPLFLNLLSEHMKEGNPFPQNTHVVFETYIKSRFARDEQRLQKRFNLDNLHLRASAEFIAFYMSADTGLGLSPSREHLKVAIEHSNEELASVLDSVLDALEFMKLARSEMGVEGISSNRFTFAHRRFQEYFATCLVLRDPTLVPPIQLLLNARWRETAVVMCQTQPLHVLAPIIEKADELLTEVSNSVLGLINELKEHVFNEKHIDPADQQEVIFDSFPWPSRLLHLLGLLQEGFTGRIVALPENLRAEVGKLVQTATEVGALSDKRWALEVAGTLPESILSNLLKQAFESSSYWLRGIAYQQAARLNEITPEIAQGIRNALIQLAGTHRFYVEKHATRAHLMRLHRSEDFLAIMQLLMLSSKIDILIHTVLLLILFPILISSKVFIWTFGMMLFFMIFSLSIIRISFFTGKFIFINIVFAIIFRISIMAILSSIFFIPTSDTTIKRAIVLPFLVICFYLIFFAPFSLLAAKTGKFTLPRWWLFLPLWPLLNFIVNPPSKTSFIFMLGYLFKNIQKIMLGLLLIALAGLFVVTGFWGLNYILYHITILSATILLITLCILSVFVIKMMSAGFYRYFKDLRRWRYWFNNHQKQIITCQDFCEATSYHSWERTLSALRRIRTEHRFAATPETELFLKTIAFEMEVRQRQVKGSKEAKSILPVYLSKPMEIEEIKGYSGLLDRKEPIILDEINMLLEDVHRAKQDLTAKL